MPKLEFLSKVPIDKGWSCDKKYCAETADGTKYLLRVTPFEKSAERENMFRMQQRVAELGIPMCLPVEYGECADGVYIVNTWIEGEDARDMLPWLSKEEQYNYGTDAGRILKKIHSIPAPDDQPEWESRFNAKTDRKIKMYRGCGLKIDGAEHFIDYIEENRHLIKNRPQCYQHGDYHIGNMMIDSDGLVIIDFDKYDFGDPWEDFRRIVWCAAETDPAFARGRVDGYFDCGEIPPDFWRLTALYISSNMIGSIPWAISYGGDEIDVMKKQFRDVLGWYDNMNRVVPRWYEKD